MEVIILFWVKAALNMNTKARGQPFASASREIEPGTTRSKFNESSERVLNP